MNLKGILNAHRSAVDSKEKARRHLHDTCHRIDQVITYVVKPVFDDAERQIAETGFDVSLELESRMLETGGANLRFTAACVLTAGKSIPASTISFDSNPRTSTIEFKKVVGGLKSETTFTLEDVTAEVVEAEVELFVVEVFPASAF